MPENQIILTGFNHCGKTWRAIASEVGCTVQTLHNWRRDIVKVPDNRWLSLCRAFGVELDRSAYRLEFDAAQRRKGDLAPLGADTPSSPPDGPEIEAIGEDMTLKAAQDASATANPPKSDGQGWFSHVASVFND